MKVLSVDPYLSFREEEIDLSHNAVFQVAVNVEDMCTKDINPDTYLKSTSINIAENLESQSYITLTGATLNIP